MVYKYFLLSAIATTAFAGSAIAQDDDHNYRRGHEMTAEQRAEKMATRKEHFEQKLGKINAHRAEDGLEPLTEEQAREHMKEKRAKWKEKHGDKDHKAWKKEKAEKRKEFLKDSDLSDEEKRKLWKEHKEKMREKYKKNNPDAKPGDAHRYKGHGHKHKGGAEDHAEE
jgi:TRAP-type C4-dicarboxylate transport system substrate-binding protein